MSYTIGYTTTPAASISLTGGSVEQARATIDSAGDVVPSSGDTVTGGQVYIAGGDATTSTLYIGLYTGGTRTDMSAATLAFSTSISVTPAMKAAPGWYPFSVSWSLTSIAGTAARVAYAGVDVGNLLIGADGSAGINSVVSGQHTLPNPWGQTLVNNPGTVPGLYLNVTTSGGASTRSKLTLLGAGA